MQPVDFLQQAVVKLSGVGGQTAKRFNKLGLFKVQDLLFHLPLRYQDRTRVYSLHEIKAGDHVLVCGAIDWADIHAGWRTMLVCRISEGNANLSLRFFHFSAQQRQGLESGRFLSAFGEVKQGFDGLEMIHPEYKVLASIDGVATESCLTPVYPLSEGLKQGTVRRAVQQALDCFKQSEHQLPDWLPTSVLAQLEYPTLSEAIITLHTPDRKLIVSDMLNRTAPAIKRLALEELLAHHLSLMQVKLKAQTFKAPVFQMDTNALECLYASLAFKLTQAQQRVIAEITADVTKATPMLRLVQGDVGCGKTIVCAVAALLAISTQYQVAVMAPTELLAEQHFVNFETWFKPLAIQVDYLSGQLKGKSRQQVLQDVAQGQAQIIIGTHALFQDQVEFANLGLIIIDEQHRFGVHQRLALKAKGSSRGFKPHQLMMTATPIPRTLAMLDYADLDISVVDELPPGRIPAVTRIISAHRRPQVIARIDDWVKGKRQAYWVCTLIEESELLQCETAENTLTLLTAQLPDVRVALVHGRLSPSEKNKIMQAFKAHQIDLLVATTVIEVGVDVANAGLMIIENPERLGLSQLHQLRGRIGRGQEQSYCLLMYQTPLSEVARQRLSIIRESNNGFVIAERDLQLRGPGEVLGTRQTGTMQFKVADLSVHADLVEQISGIAHTIHTENPEAVPAIIGRWINTTIDYAEV